MTHPATLPALLHAAWSGAGPAVVLDTPEGPRLSGVEAWQALQGVAEALRARGIGRDDRVALAMPDGLPTAVAALGTAAAAAAAPLNPRYTADEFHFYLGDLGARALIAGTPVPAAAEAAAQLGIPVWSFALAPGGAVTIDGDSPYAPAPDRAPRDGDEALLLHTSGTTARPKLTPLTHANLCASAAHIGATLALSPADRGLNVMPLFHIHGLIAGLLAPLGAGGAVICTTGFDASAVPRWLERCAPTWYSAVPTMHQAILARMAAPGAPRLRRPLRFVRSSSAALPPSVMAEMEATLGAPVIEAYGMTEAAHQMASNPLPPAVRKPGTVGRAAGPEVAVMAPDGDTLLPVGAAGEIVIAGPNVTPGYLDNPEANARAFSGRWFRTGDQGVFDADGYLTITGRLKELINRGGEKIAPREIDEALLTHPAVAQAVAFGVPDPQLGEEVAAAVVLHPGATVTDDDLRRHVAAHLASFKVPRRLLRVDAIPKGPTGKLQRVGLAAVLGVAGPPPGRPPATAPAAPGLEADMAALWQEVLECSPPAPDTNFLEAGGDSLAAARLIARLNERFGLALTFVDLLDAPTLRDQAEVVARAQAGVPPA